MQRLRSHSTTSLGVDIAVTGGRGADPDGAVGDPP